MKNDQQFCSIVNRYVAGPITSYARLRINTRPELDGSQFTIPKIYLNLTMEEIAVGLTPCQYQDMILLLDSIERMSCAAPYRKVPSIALNENT